MAQTKNVNMTPNGTLPRLHLSQYDVGRELAFKLCDGALSYTVPTGATVKLMGTKPSGFGFTETCTVSGSTASISTTDSMTDEWGAVACELVVEISGIRLGSTNLLLVVEKSPHPEGTTDGNQETVIPTLTLLVERVESAASSILDMTVVADTLPAGSDATYSYDEETNTATFGIPKGADGTLASGVLAPTYSTSATYAVGDYVYYSGSLYRCTTAITTAESWTSGHWTQVALAPEVSDLKVDLSALENNVYTDLYYHETNTDVFYWRPNSRVNSQGSTYSTGQTYWTGLYKTNEPERIQLEVKAGSTFVAKTGYTLDYALRANGVTKQIERGVAAGTTITIEYDGILLLAVSDGSSETSPAENAKAVAKAGLTIDLITKPISEIVLQNTADIETLETECESLAEDVESLKADERKAYDSLSDLVSAQKEISDDWHFGFVNVAQGMGLGSNHIIPATKNIWNENATADLDQKGVWMSDGVHPFKGDGVTDMYARTIAPQLAMIVPSYRDGVGATSPSVWAGRNILWMGTSITAGSDPEAGEGTGSTYPALVASLLGATSINKSKGSSCVRINASTGEYTGMIFTHFARALSRTSAEVDDIASNWDSIKGYITYAPDTLSEANVNTMKSHSFENLLVPYLDGTYTMPDLFVLDHGHNDVRPKGIDGENDLWIEPTASNITSGLLAEDTYMTSNSYANLKVALNDDLSGITDLASFASSLNRNCFKGAMNFIITVILRYNPYARIAIVSDYN